MQSAETSSKEDLFSIPVVTIAGEKTTLEPYRNKVILVVNTASKCGFTKQYKGLEALWQEYGDQGFVLLGFPCDQFGGQEPGTEEEIKNFCERNFGVSFPLFSKVEVNGADAHPLFKQLKEKAPGILNSTSIKWNFTKFLLSPGGKDVERFGSRTKPDEMKEKIEAWLQQVEK